MRDLLITLQDYFGDNLIWVAVASAILLLFIIFEIADKISSKKQANFIENELPENAFDEEKQEQEIKEMSIDAPPNIQAAETENPEEEQIKSNIKPDINSGIEEKPIQQLHININIERGVVKIEKAGADISCCISEDKEKAFECDEATAPKTEPATSEADLSESNRKSGKDYQTVQSDTSDNSFAPCDEKADLYEAKITESVSNIEGDAEIENFADSKNEKIVLEKLEILKAAPPKKFGPENMNTGRSGRVFTEEELDMLIKE